ncbi:hypothetical protein KF707_03585 [Candidatus Obscuribacterales bacterium]|nr:hypothetical protein [Candidatus Obscuribacterales bacterium]MBX3153425.1 hypothetical protein [Candidatus Obscuribacterales bacterium]
MSESPDKTTELIRLLQNTTDQEIDCDTFWEKAAELAERDISLPIGDLKTYLHHLELCPGCAEEFALLKMVINE